MGHASQADTLRKNFHGRVIDREDGEYDEARKIWNGTIDRRPALIAQCADTSDVVTAVNLAREEGLALAVRGGGHNVSGNATCDDGLVIDLRRMKGISVDAERRRARAEGGVIWREYDAETQKHGLASPGGAISTTGIAGLTLGGGFGWLSRSYGLACDNMVSAELVNAKGEVLIASAEENADLFWGLRGGGGNFGVVTRFEYRLQPVGELYAGLLLYPRNLASDFMRVFADWTADAPDSVSSMAAFLSTPDGDPVVGVFVVHHGPTNENERVVAKLRSAGSPLHDDIGPKPYTVVQQALDAGFPSGNRNYWKSSYLSTVGEDCSATLVEHANQAPSPMCVVGLEHMLGGAVGRVGADETAFGSRDVAYNLLMLGMSDDPGLDEAIKTWARGMEAAVRPFSTGGLYVNYMDNDEADRVRDAYGETHYSRLAQLKKRHDPENLFRLNQNIVPAG